MKKSFFCILFLIFSCVYVFGQKLQFNHYTYSDLGYISVNQYGKSYIKIIGVDNENEIFVNVDEYGYKKLINDNYNLYILDGGLDYFISPKIAVRESVKFPDGIYRIPDCKLNGVHIKNITASSTLTDKYHTYSADGTLSSWYSGDCDIWGFVKNCVPWVEGKDDYGIGEYIEFELDYSSYRNNNYDGWIIKILNGYVNPEKPHLYKQNSRVKKATLITDGNKKYNVSFNDYVEITNIKIPKNVNKIKLIINEVYEGTKYSDTCISGIGAERYVDYD